MLGERGSTPHPRRGVEARDPAFADRRELDRRHVAIAVALREACADDLDAIEWLGLGPEQRAAIEATLERCARGEEIVLVAEARGAPVAMLRIRVARRADPRIAAIEALRVMPGLQGLGIASALLAAGERLLRERGRALVETRIARHARAELARFERLGYVRTGIGWDGRVVLRKSLDLLAARPLHRTPRVPVGTHGRTG